MYHINIIIRKVFLMEHARKPVRKSWHPVNLAKKVAKFWGQKKGKAILFGSAAVVVALVVLLVWLLWPAFPMASGNSGLAVQIGSTIYYANANQQNHLYAMNTDGSDNHLVTAESIGDLVTDGEMLYAYINDEYQYIWSIDPETGMQQLLMDTASGDLGYANGYIYYTDFNQDRVLYSLYLSDTNVSTRLTELPTYDISSDGENVYFRYGRDGNYQLCSVPLAGGEVTTILAEVVLDAVYYEGTLYYINEERHLCSIQPDGSENRVLSQESFSNLVVFEDQIYFIYNGEVEDERTGNLCRINLDGSNLEVLVQGSYSSINAVENRIFFLDNDLTMYVYDLSTGTFGTV